MAELESLNETDWEAFANAPLSVLVIGKSDCPSCIEWSEALATFLAKDQKAAEWAHVRFAKATLDKPGLTAFKRASRWLAEVDALPFNVIFSSGVRVKSYAGSGVERLLNRLRRISAEAD